MRKLKKIKRVRLGNKTASKTVNEGSTPSTFVALKCLGRIFKTEGTTLEDALNKIKISGGTRTLSILTVQQGERKRTKILSGSLTNKLFGHISNTAKIIGLKQVKQMFPL